MEAFRPARQAHAAWNVTKTLASLLLFWFVYLFLLPIGISIVEIELGIQRFPPQLAAAGLLLACFTLLAVWAAVTLAVVGRGTPVPFDTAREFVAAGPYAFVRHPFVLAVMGQGVGVGIALGSIPVLAYVAASASFWYFVVRPREERDLARRFGRAWSDYARAVRGFRPRLTPYRPARAAR